MIIGVLQRGFKAFSSTQYVPLVGDENLFSLIVGDNGIGKSTVLEALNFFFVNHDGFISNKTGKRGMRDASRDGFVAPLFLLDSDELKKLSPSEMRIVISIDDFLRVGKSVDAAIKNQLKNFPSEKWKAVLLTRYRNDVEHGDNCFPQGSLKDEFTSKSLPALGLQKEDFDGSKGNGKLRDWRELRDNIAGRYSYIYLPVEGNDKHFANLDSRPLRVLAEVDLGKAVDKAIGGNETKKKIIDDLQAFIDDIGKDLESYKYKDKTQTGFTQKLLRETIIEKYLSSKVLHKSTGPNGKTEIAFNHLSAGEKTQAVVALCRALILKGVKANDKVILAIDEPEASLHVSRVFEQFDILRGISKNVQTVVTTHWYGFMSVLDVGWVQSLTKAGDQFEVDTLDLADFYQQKRRLKTNSEEPRPFRVMLKADSEFRLSIINSLCLTRPINWIICEGLTDKIYLECLLGSATEDLPINIVPVAGQGNVEKFFKKLYPEILDYKDEIGGNVVCLVDTDSRLPSPAGYENNAAHRLWFKRLNNDKNGTQLRALNDSSSGGLTSIEDVLPALPFIRALQIFESEMPIDLLALSAKPDQDISFFHMDLRASEHEQLRAFLAERHSGRKMRLAKEFRSVYQPDVHGVPDWVDEIIAIFVGRSSQ